MTEGLTIPTIPPPERLGTQLSWAMFSACRTYRYVLGREWPNDGAQSSEVLTWCMLNPSTADETELDPTLRRCAAFSRAWGYAGFYVINAYAYRATDPKDLPRDDGVLNAWAIGPHNDELIRFWSAGRDIVVGWGVGCHVDRAHFMGRALAGANRVDCLGTNKDGSPKHPLYIAASTQRQPWSAPP